MLTSDNVTVKDEKGKLKKKESYEGKDSEGGGGRGGGGGGVRHEENKKGENGRGVKDSWRIAG